MKREGINHPKTRALARGLGIPQYAAVGLLECLWAFTSTAAPCGDVGKWSNDEIAEGMFWDGKPDKLVDALVAARLLDRCGVHRLVVHDWHEHADKATRNKVNGRRLTFVRVETPVTISPATGGELCNNAPMSGDGAHPPGPGAGAEPGAGAVVHFDEIEIAFSEFWKRYPNKRNKQTAFKAFQKACKRGGAEVVSIIMEALERHVAACQGVEKRFIPHAATWLNQERYLDDPEDETDDPTATPGDTSEAARFLNG